MIPSAEIVSCELKDIPHKPWLKIPGATNESELDWLHEQAKGKKLIYEIGSFLGRSTVAMLESGSNVIAVDDFKGMREEKQSDEFRANIYNEFLKNTKAYYNLAIQITDHANFVPVPSCDMVFIDGCHYYDQVMRDILKFKDFKDILICGHDFHWWNSVREAVIKVFGTNFSLYGPNLWFVKQ